MSGELFGLAGRCLEDMTASELEKLYFEVTRNLSIKDIKLTTKEVLENEEIEIVMNSIKLNRARGIHNELIVRRKFLDSKQPCK